MSSKSSNQTIFENWRKYTSNLHEKQRARSAEAGEGGATGSWSTSNLPAAENPDEASGLDELVTAKLQSNVEKGESYAHKMVVQIEQGSEGAFGFRTPNRRSKRKRNTAHGVDRPPRSGTGRIHTAQFIKISYFDDTGGLLNEFVYPNYNESEIVANFGIKREDTTAVLIDLEMLGIKNYICLDSKKTNVNRGGPGVTAARAKGIGKDGWIEDRAGLQLLWGKIVEQMKTKDKIPQADFLVITEQHTISKPAGTIGQFSPMLKMEAETNLGTKSKSAVTSELIAKWLKEYVETKRAAILKRSKAYKNLKKLQKEAKEQPKVFEGRGLKYKNELLGAGRFLKLMTKVWKQRKNVTTPAVAAEDKAMKDQGELDNFIAQAKKAWRGAPNQFNFKVTRLVKIAALSTISRRNMVRKEKEFSVHDIGSEFYKQLLKPHILGTSSTSSARGGQITKPTQERVDEEDYPEQLRDLGSARRIYHVKDMAEDGKTIFWFIANVKDKKIEYIFLPIAGEVSKTQHLINRIRHVATGESLVGAPGVKHSDSKKKKGSAIKKLEEQAKPKDLSALGFIPFSVAERHDGVKKAVGKTESMGSADADNPVKSLAAAFDSKVNRTPVQKPTSSKYKLYSGVAGRLAAARNVDIEKVKEARKLEKTRGRFYPEDSHFSVEPLEKMDRDIGIGYQHYKVTKELDKDGLPELLRRDAGIHATGAWKKAETGLGGAMIGHIHNPGWLESNKLHIYDKVAAKLFIPGSKDPDVAQALGKYINDTDYPERLKTMASVLQNVYDVKEEPDKEEPDDDDEVLEILGDPGEPGSVSAADTDFSLEYDFNEPDKFSIIATVFNEKKPSEKFQQHIKYDHDLGNYKQDDKIYVQLTNPLNFGVTVESIDIQPPEMRRKFSLYIEDSSGEKRPGQAPGQLNPPLLIEPGKTLGGDYDDPIYFFVEAAAGENVSPEHAEKAREEENREAGFGQDPRKMTGEPAAPWESGESRDGYFKAPWEPGPKSCKIQAGRWDAKDNRCWVPDGTERPAGFEDDMIMPDETAPKVNQAVASAVAAADPNAGQSLDFLKKYGGLDPHKIKNKKYGPTIRKIYPKIGNDNMTLLGPLPPGKPESPTRFPLKMIFDFEKNKERYSNLRRKASLWRNWTDKLDDGDPRKTDVAGGELIKQNFDKVLAKLRSKFKNNKHPTMEKVYKLIDTGFFGGEPEIEDIKNAFKTLHHHYDDQSRRIEKWLQRNSVGYGTAIAQVYKIIPPHLQKYFPGVGDPHKAVEQGDRSRQLDSLSDVVWTAIKTNYQEYMKTTEEATPIDAAKHALGYALTQVFKGDTNVDGVTDERDAVIPRNVLSGSVDAIERDKGYVQSKLANWICPDTGHLDAKCVLKGLAGAGMASRFDVQPEKEPEAVMTATTTPIIEVPGLGIRVSQKPGAEVHKKYGKQLIWADGDKCPDKYTKDGHLCIINNPLTKIPLSAGHSPAVAAAPKINKAIDAEKKLDSTEAQALEARGNAVLCRIEGGTWDIKNKKCSVDLPGLAKNQSKKGAPRRKKVKGKK